MKVAELIAAALAAAGVEHVPCVMGDGNLELLVALEAQGVRVVHARHEAGAVAMADGYARVSGKVGVCSVTMGAGLSQVGTSLASARGHAAPVLLIAGAPPLPRAGGGFDQLAFARACGADADAVLSAAAAAPTLRDAYARAVWGGPMVLNLPTDVAAAEAPEGPLPDLRPAPPPPAVPPAREVALAAAALQAARRPAIVAGRGAFAAQEAIGALADRLGAPIATTLLAMGLCSDHPRHVGVAGALGGGRATAALEGADCVLALGASLNGWTTSGGRALAGARVLRVDADPLRLAGPDPPDVALVGDARAAVELLLERLGPPTGAGPPPPVAPPARDGLPTTFDDGPGTVDPRRALVALDRALGRDRLVVVDGGHFVTYATELVLVEQAGRFVWTGGFAAIGQGLATAIGAALAHPDGRTTLLVGDGGLMMGLAELDTAVRYGLALTVFVANDQGYGQERHNLRERGHPGEGADLPTPDLAALARAWGAEGLRVDEPADLDSLAPAIAEARGPLLVDVRVNPELVSAASREIAAQMRDGR